MPPTWSGERFQFHQTRRSCHYNAPLACRDMTLVPGKKKHVILYTILQYIFMAKKQIALVAGGDSGEFEISMQSAAMVKENIDPSLFQVYLLLLTKDRWVYVDDAGVEHPVDKNDFSIKVGEEKVLFDCAFIIIHGTPGEDGRLQAYFDLLDIPYTTAGQLAAALTFNKHYCNMLVSALGVPVAKSVLLKRPDGIIQEASLSDISLPVFVKPNQGGSSLGTFFVQNNEDLLPAIEAAFEHDDEVLVEAYLDGVELTCGVYLSEGSVQVLPATEIVSKTAARFFDFKAKYTPGAADEITPARISTALAAEVQALSAKLYQQLDLKGLVRFDFIYSGGTFYFLEVNITPGMSATSIVPQQAAVAGITNTALFTTLIREALTCK